MKGEGEGDERGEGVRGEVVGGGTDRRTGCL